MYGLVRSEPCMVSLVGWAPGLAEAGTRIRLGFLDTIAGRPYMSRASRGVLIHDDGFDGTKDCRGMEQSGSSSGS